jgi:transcriptional regulator with XRE-family HTH domain
MKTARELEQELINSGDLKRGSRIYMKRLHYNLSLHAIARETQISVSTLSRVERGIGEPTLAVAITLARFFESSVEDLFG